MWDIGITSTVVWDVGPFSMEIEALALQETLLMRTWLDVKTANE